VHDARIATVNVLEQYPLFGDDLSNYVQPLGVRGPHGKYSSITTCTAWLKALNDGRYSYVYIATRNFTVPTTETPQEVTWTRSDPNAHLVFTQPVSGARVWLFALRHPLQPSSCAQTEAERAH
jgi:hypothetical protein